MSKAFTKDDGPAEAVALPVGPALPAGAKNYVTAAGANALRERLRAAQDEVERQRAAGDGAALAQAQERLRFLQTRFDGLEAVAPPDAADDRVRFGATVVSTDETGRERRVRIVGIDEADAARGAVSWTSPIARALLGHRVGDEVQLQTPQGNVTLEIVAVRYEPV